jgi:DNA-binding IclR family transcriptional regulator
VKRKVIRLLHYIQRLNKLGDEGVSQAEIGRRLGFPPTTVNTVIKNKKKFLLKCYSSEHYYN